MAKSDCLIPAGLIRSQSTQQLRELLLEQGTKTEVTQVFENRARFFPIDTRFKFLIVQAIRGGRRQAQITIRHARGCGDQVAGVGQRVSDDANCGRCAQI